MLSYSSVTVLIRACCFLLLCGIPTQIHTTEYGDSVRQDSGTMKQINLEDTPLTMAAIVRRRAEAIKHNSECETDDQRHNQTFPPLGTGTIAASDSGVFMSTSDIDRTHSASTSTQHLSAVEEYTEGQGAPTKSSYVIGEQDEDEEGEDDDEEELEEEEEEEDVIELDQSHESKTDSKLSKRTCQSLPDVNSPRPNALNAIGTTCDSSSDTLVAPKKDEIELRCTSEAAAPCDTGGPAGKQATAPVGPVSGSQRKTVDPSLLQAFFIDPKLINKFDGLEHTLYYIDENGSPKLRDKFSVQQQLADEKKRRKKAKKMEKYSSDGEDDTAQCNCFSFSRLSKKFRDMCKYSALIIVDCIQFSLAFQLQEHEHGRHHSHFPSLSRARPTAEDAKAALLITYVHEKENPTKCDCFRALLIAI